MLSLKKIRSKETTVEELNSMITVGLSRKTERELRKAKRYFPGTGNEYINALKAVYSSFNPEKETEDEYTKLFNERVSALNELGYGEEYKDTVINYGWSKAVISIVNSTYSGYIIRFIKTEDNKNGFVMHIPEQGIRIFKVSAIRDIRMNLNYI